METDNSKHMKHIPPKYQADESQGTVRNRSGSLFLMKNNAQSSLPQMFHL